MTQEAVADARIRAMLEAFAGSDVPLTTAAPARRRRATRRTVVLVLVVLVGVGLAVPGSLALLGRWQTPQQFFADPSQPELSKGEVRDLLWDANCQTLATPHHDFGGPPANCGHAHISLLEITSFAAHTPDGLFRVYGLKLSHGYTGVAWTNRRQTPWPVDVQFLPPSLAAERACPRGWALQRLWGGWTIPIRPGYGYVLGRASSKVASVHVLYPDGGTARGAVRNGYFLAWMKPSVSYRNVTVIAEDAGGKTIGRLRVAGYGGVPWPHAKQQNLHACG